MSEKPQHSKPAVYAIIYQICVRVGREHGYAMALHGSMARDLDIIAVPWTEDAADADTLLGALKTALEAYSDSDHKREPGVKPHGRVAHTLDLWGGFIDLSVMPRVEAA